MKYMAVSIQGKIYSCHMERKKLQYTNLIFKQWRYWTKCVYIKQLHYILSYIPCVNENIIWNSDLTHLEVFKTIETLKQEYIIMSLL